MIYNTMGRAVEVCSHKNKQKGGYHVVLELPDGKYEVYNTSFGAPRPVYQVVWPSHAKRLWWES